MIITKNQLFAFLFGLGATISIRIVGIFAISDLVAMFFLPFLVQKTHLFKNKKFRAVIILLIFWMISTVISDIYNHTSTIDALKGFFTLVPFLACLLFAYWLLRQDFELMIPFVWGYAISFTISAGFGLDAYYIESINREGLSSITQLVQYNKIITWIIASFITGAISITYFKKFPHFVTLLLFFFSFVPLIEGSRSTFLITFFVSITLIYILLVTRELPWDGVIWQEKLKTKLPKLVLIAFILIFSAKGIYEFSVTRGYLGGDEKDKYEMQNNTKLGLLSGRSEFVSSILAIIDSPILGHGSYAKDTKGYGYQAAILTGHDKESLNWNINNIGKNYIPTHSHLWTAWVSNGILGGIFWIYILIWILLVFATRYLFLYPKYLAYILSSLLITFWNILFSPFSQKPVIATSIVFFIVLMEFENQQELE